MGNTTRTAMIIILTIPIIIIMISRSLIKSLSIVADAVGHLITAPRIEKNEGICFCDIPSTFRERSHPAKPALDKLVKLLKKRPLGAFRGGAQELCEQGVGPGLSFPVPFFPRP